MAISSFTMFFEVGNISGGVVFGLIAELASKRAAFGSAVVLCGVGTWLLLARVVARVLTRAADVPGARRRRLTAPVARSRPERTDGTGRPVAVQAADGAEATDRDVRPVALARVPPRSRCAHLCGWS